MSEKRSLQPEDLYRLRLISDPQIAPDGSRVAFVLKQADQEKNDYISNVYVADRYGNVVQFTSGDKDSAPRWSPDGTYLAFLSGRKDKAQVHLLSTSGGESVALTDRKLGAGVPFWSPDSTAIAFVGPVSTDPEEAEMEDKDEKKPARTKIVERVSYKLDGAGYIGNIRRHIFLIDVAGRSVEQLTDGDHHEDNPAWSPDSQHIAFWSKRAPRWDVSTESDIYLLPRKGGQPRRLTEGGAYFNPVFSPDGSRVAFAGRRDRTQVSAPYRLYSVNRSGSDFREELEGWDGGMGNEVTCDIVQSDNGLSLSWREGGIYFLGTERGECNVYRAGGGVQPVTKGKHTITDFSMANDGTLVYTCADATHPAEVFVQGDDGSRRLTGENDAFLEEVQLAVPERFTFTGANGEDSEGWLLPPCERESGKHPLIAYIHGGPFLAHGEAMYFEYQFLAGQGFGVFYPNIHGSASYGHDYQVSINGDWGNLDYQDVQAGTEAAASREWVDQQRLGIAGGSYGGFMTNWVMTHCDRFRAAVTERCLCNLLSFMGTSDVGWLFELVFLTGLTQDPIKLWEMSPIKYVANVSAPMLVIHSERDDRTPVEQGEQMFAALRGLGKEARLIVFPEESHGLSRMGKPSRRVERLGYIADWFREKL